MVSYKEHHSSKTTLHITNLICSNKNFQNVPRYDRILWASLKTSRTFVLQLSVSVLGNTATTIFRYIYLVLILGKTCFGTWNLLYITNRITISKNNAPITKVIREIPDMEVLELKHISSYCVCIDNEPFFCEPCVGRTQ